MSNEFTLDLPGIAAGGRMLQVQCHGNSAASGWWTDPKTGAQLIDQVTMRAQNLIPLKLVLCHSELSEALEGYRKGLQDDHLPHRTMLEAELADTVIRIFDLAGACAFDLGATIAEKLEYNSRRPDHKLAARTVSGGKSF